MFLVELSYNTIKEEIFNLDEKQNRKGDALKDSSLQLDTDSAKLIKFIESDNMTTQDKKKEADTEVVKRKKAEVDIKKDEADIQNIRSEIDKNND